MKITEDFIGNETKALTKTKISTILRWWGFDPDSYSTWGNARSDMNNILSGSSSSTISDRERASSFLSKINYINDTDTVISDTLFAANEPGVWYDPSDLSTLFQNAAGTTPVTAVEQPVGLMLDKSKGLVLGPELVVNGDFPVNLSGWAPYDGTPTWVAPGAMRLDSTSTRQSTYQDIATVAGKTYEIRVTLSNFTAGGVNPALYVWSGPFNSLLGYLGASAGSFVGRFTATASTIRLQPYADFGSIADFDNISVRELPGNHARQTTATSRPVLSARVNLLTKTEDLSDAAWIKQLCSISPNLITAPDGTLTADKVVEDTTSAVHRIEQNVTVVDGVSYTISVAAKKAERSFLQLFEDTAGRGAAVFDLATGVVSSVVSGTAAIKDLGNGWFRCSVTYVQSGTTGRFRIAPQAGATPGAYLGDGTSGIYIWGADFRVANDGVNLPPYQRVNTATDYDAVGFPHYLRFDGVDDWLVTNTITPGTDKAQMFAGVRKLSDAATGLLVELSASADSNGGGFYLASLASLSSGAWQPQTGPVAARTYTPYFLGAAPRTSVLATVLDNAAIGAGEISLSENGQVRTSTAVVEGDGASGNFLAYPLYIGRRGGTTFPFNGRLYSLIVRFGNNLPTATIERTEKYINGLTKAY